MLPSGTRRYGLLLHISSLPSAWGIGDLGPEAHAFAHMLAELGASVWQILPLNPTSTYIGNSPYSSPSAFAGNPLFISPELLMRDGWISYGDLDASLSSAAGTGLGSNPRQVDYPAVTAHRRYILDAAWEAHRPRLADDKGFEAFCRDNAYWLDDYARFVSMKEFFGGRAWFQWPDAYARRDFEALADWDERARQAMDKEKFIQFLFFSQWHALRATCREAGVSLLGDIPIYVSHDSADVWANPEYFDLGEDLQPVMVSGVPPDYFSPVGQRWGNPVYRWEVLERHDFAWWKDRLRHSLQIVDIARLDHFRGFLACWVIPASEETAVNGEWSPVPGRAFFTSLREYFGGLPFLAEDLGTITEDVREFMNEFELPGMHVLQFAFSGSDFASNNDAPHNHHRRSFVYTGTHDNTTTRDWFREAPDLDRRNMAAYLGREVQDPTAAESLIRLAFASVANCAVVPVQDVLNLGSDARMNTPGLAEGNWTWRLEHGQMQASHLGWLRELAGIYGRTKHPSRHD